MKLEKMTVALALASVCLPGVAWSQGPTQPPPQPEPEIDIEEPVQPGQPYLPPPAPLKEPAPKPPAPPKNVRAEPATDDSRTLTTRAASAEISGDPQEALELSKRATEADPRDPWPYYVRASAFARIGQIDDAIQSFKAAEARFAASDVWARSVAIYGAAHALAEAGRCDEARVEFHRYAVFVRERDPKSADMATRYGANCKPPAAEVK